MQWTHSNYRLKHFHNHIHFGRTRWAIFEENQLISKQTYALHNTFFSTIAPIWLAILVHMCLIYVSIPQNIWLSIYMTSVMDFNIHIGFVLVRLNYIKVDPKWIHWVIKHGHIVCKKQGITYIKSYFVIDLGSFKCYLFTFITNLQLFYIRMGVTWLTW